MECKSFIIGANGLEEITVNADDKKNSLPIGTVLHQNGYNNAKSVIVKNLGINKDFKSYGAKYRTVHLENFTFGQTDAQSIDHIDDKKDNRIHTYYTDEILPEAELAQVIRVAETKQAETKKAAEEASAAADVLEAKGRALFAKYIPGDAKALIIACEEIDDSDSMTDYFSTKHGESVIIGFSTHTRDIFSEMRKHANKIPETSHLAEKAEGIYEHREKHSMGAGFYLKVGSRYSTAWKIEKSRKYGDDWTSGDYISLARRCVFTGDGFAVSTALAGYIEGSGLKPSNESIEDFAAEHTDPANVQYVNTVDVDREPATTGEYKGNPTISLSMGNGRAFCFGIAKAQAILECIDDIRAFVEAQD